MLQLRPATKFMDSLFTSGMVLRDAAAAPVPHTFTHTSDSHVLPTTYLLVPLQLVHSPQVQRIAGKIKCGINLHLIRKLAENMRLTVIVWMPRLQHSTVSAARSDAVQCSTHNPRINHSSRPNAMQLSARNERRHFPHQGNFWIRNNNNSSITC